MSKSSRNTYSKSCYGLNLSIVRSMKMDKDLKSYFISKYKILCKCNGIPFACRLFKSFREWLIRYKSDPDRVNNLSEYRQACPFRFTRKVQRVLLLLETNPSTVLNFFKLYVNLNGPLTDPEDAERDMHLKLKEIPSDDTIPTPLIQFFTLINELRSKHGYRAMKRRAEELYWYHRLETTSYFHRLATKLSLNSWWEYWMKWERISRIHIRTLESLPDWRERPVLPEHYADYEADSVKITQYPNRVKKKFTNENSATYETDLYDIMLLYQDACDAMEFGTNDSVLPYDVARYLVDNLNDDMFLYPEDLMLQKIWNEDTGEGYFARQQGVVGHIHHIPKKGTVDRRSIAAANRFIQAKLVDFSAVLYSILRHMPRDCTYNQDKLDNWLQLRVNNARYVGCVDISSATDNLPFRWGEYILSCFEISFDDADSQRRFDLSHRLFTAVARGPWANGEFTDQWTVGQPLGTLPSFAILGLTNGFLQESIAAHLGYAHSPYGTLGDDTVFTNKRLRDVYIGVLAKHHIPLSLHKSYENRLVEFAGKLYMKGFTFRCTDQGLIRFDNLFDYQKGTRVWVQYEYLSNDIRQRISMLTAAEGLQSSVKVAKKVYNLCQYILVGYDDCRYSQLFPVESYAIYHSLVKEPEKVLPENPEMTGLTFGFGTILQVYDANGLRRALPNTKSDSFSILNKKKEAKISGNRVSLDRRSCRSIFDGLSTEYALRAACQTIAKLYPNDLRTP